MTLDGSEPNPAVDSLLLPQFPHTVEVPPLRHHLDDLTQLVPFLLREQGRATDVRLSGPALNQLHRLSWPGNVTQLRSTLAKIVRLRRSGTLQVDDLPPECRATSRRQLTRMEALERDAIISALDAHDGNKARAATSLGMSRATIYRKIKDFGISTR